MKFSGICLLTDCVPALVDFYTRVLGCSFEGDESHAEFTPGGLSLAIFSRQGMEQMAPGCLQGAGQGGFTIGFEVDDVDAHCARLLSLGVPIVKPPASYPWGTRSVWFRDPEGNIVNFYSRISSQGA